MVYVTWPTFLILGPLHISGIGAARDFKFRVPIDCQAYKPRNAKLGQKGSGLRHMTYLNFMAHPVHTHEETQL